MNVTALDLTEGTEAYTAVLQESSDNATFTAAGATLTITAAGVAAVRGWATKRYVRLSLSILGTTPSMTFKAWLNPLP